MIGIISALIVGVVVLVLNVLYVKLKCINKDEYKELLNETKEIKKIKIKISELLKKQDEISSNMESINLSVKKYNNYNLDKMVDAIKELYDINQEPKTASLILDLSRYDSDILKLNERIKSFEKKLENVIYDIKKDEIDEVKNKIFELKEQIEKFDNKTETDSIPDINRIGDLERQLTEVLNSQKLIQQNIRNFNGICQQFVSQNLLNEIIKNNDFNIKNGLKNSIEQINNKIRQENHSIIEQVNELKEVVFKEIDNLRIKIEEPQKPNTVIKVDRNYINSLVGSLTSVKDILLKRDYESILNIFNEIIEDSDFEDSEEIMGEVNSAIEKYVVGSFSKVKKEQREFLKKFITDAGYTEILVKTGDAIKTYVTYFSEVFQETCTNENLIGTIKEIYLKPYQLIYSNDGDTDKLIIKGQCCAYCKEK